MIFFLRENPIVYEEACALFSTTFDLLYDSSKARSDFFFELYDFLGQTEEGQSSSSTNGVISQSCSFSQSSYTPGSSSDCLRFLEKTILQNFSDSLNKVPAVSFTEGLKWILDTPSIIKVIDKAIAETKEVIVKVAEADWPPYRVIQITSNYPVTSVHTTYLNSVVNHLLKALTVNATSPHLPTSTNNSPNIQSRTATDMAVEVFREILKAGPRIVESILEVISGSAEEITYEVYSVTEAILKSTLLAHGIPQILGYLSLDQAPRHFLEELTEECIQLTVAMSFVSSNLHFSKLLFKMIYYGCFFTEYLLQLAKNMNPGSGSVNGQPGSHLDVSDDWSTKIRVPSPWTTKRTFESPHPIRESYKTKEAIVIPEARQLYAKLSPQCATQYDYDRLTFLSTNSLLSPAITSTNAAVGTPPPSAPQPKKLFEFGGNYYGYGNRFFNGPGWARPMIKLCDGSSVQYSFEMKSGREHSVPDKALYGYQFTLFPVMDNSDLLKPQKDTSNENDNLPLYPITPGFATTAALHCIDVMQNICRVLLEGSALTTMEKNNAVLLENRLVASLEWQSALKEEPLPRKYSAELIAKVKRVVGIAPLQMRTSIM